MRARGGASHGAAALRAAVDGSAAAAPRRRRGHLRRMRQRSFAAGLAGRRARRCNAGPAMACARK
jgi:hypothetical protein